MKRETKVRGSREEGRGKTSTVSTAFRTSSLFPRTSYLVVLLVVVFFAQSALACPVCLGNPNDPMVKGVNKGIWVLLGFITFVQIGFIALFWSFWRRSKERQRFRDSFHIVRSHEGGPLT